MDGFFFLIMFTGLEWTSLGLPRWAACTLQSFITFCFLYDSPSYFLLFCYVVILILLCSFELHQKRDGTGSQFIGDGGPAGDANWFRFLPCLREFMQRTKGMYTPILSRPCLQVNHFNSISYDPSLCYCRICGRGLSMMKLLIMFVLLILPCFH